MCVRAAKLTAADASFTFEQKVHAVLSIHEHRRHETLTPQGKNSITDARQRVAVALGLGADTSIIEQWEADLLAALPRRAPRSHAYDEKDRPALFRARIDARLGDLTEALEQGAEVEQRGERQQSMNIVQALRHALYRTDGGGSATNTDLITDLECVAAKYIDKVIRDDWVRVPRDRLRGPTHDRNTLLGAKKAALAAIEEALRKHGVGPSSDDFRLNKRELDDVLRNVQRNADIDPDAHPMGRVALEVCAAFALVVLTGRFDSELSQREYLSRSAAIQVAIAHAIKRGCRRPDQIGKAILYALGVPWQSTKMKYFFEEAHVAGRPRKSRTTLLT